MPSGDRRTIFLPELAKDRILRNETFENCDFKGPAVVAFMGHINMSECAFAEDIEDVLWEFKQCGRTSGSAR